MEWPCMAARITGSLALTDDGTADGSKRTNSEVFCSQSVKFCKTHRTSLNFNYILTARLSSKSTMVAYRCKVTKTAKTTNMYLLNKQTLTHAQVEREFKP